MINDSNAIIMMYFLGAGLIMLGAVIYSIGRNSNNKNKNDNNN